MREAPSLVSVRLDVIAVMVSSRSIYASVFRQPIGLICEECVLLLSDFYWVGSLALVVGVDT